MDGENHPGEHLSEAFKGGNMLESWLNKNMRVRMTDGRTLTGVFLCTDKNSNVILGSCQEYLKLPEENDIAEEPRMLGLAMIPGHHIVKIEIDVNKS